jgi:uncharacterized protein YceK
MRSKNIHPYIKLLCLASLLWMTSGCSGFHRAWKAEQSKATTYAKEALTGAWEGTWLSDVNGHHGRLRALITENSDGTYHAWYHAKYKRILSFSYSVDMEAQDIPDGHAFNGKANLGKLAGGVYAYEGFATNGIYNATYDSKYDHGVFKMERPSADE